MKRLVLVLLLVSVSLATLMSPDCDNRVWLYVHESATIEGYNITLLETGTSLTDVKVIIDGGDFNGENATFEHEYTEVGDLLFRVTVYDDSIARMHVSVIRSYDEGEEILFDKCENIAAKVDGQFIVLKVIYPPEDYPDHPRSTEFYVDWDVVTVNDGIKNKQYTGDTHIIEETAFSLSTSVTIKVTPLEIPTVNFGEEFTLHWDGRAAAKLDGEIFRMKPNCPTACFIWGEESNFITVEGEAWPTTTGHSITVTDADDGASPPYTKVVVSELVEMEDNGFELDCIEHPYGLLPTGAFVGFQKAFDDTDRVWVRHGGSYFSRGLGMHEAIDESHNLGDGGWVFLVDTLNVQGSDCEGTLKASKSRYEWGFGEIELEATPELAVSYVGQGRYMVFLVSADDNYATLFVSSSADGELMFPGKNHKLREGDSIELAWNHEKHNLTLLSAEPNKAVIDVAIIGGETPPGDGNQAPVAILTGPETAVVGETVVFSGADSYDPDGEIVSYKFNFADGATDLTVATVSHAYELVNTYHVTLTVTDNNGTVASDTYQIRIAGDPSAIAPPYSPPSPTVAQTPTPEPTPEPTATPEPTPEATPEPSPTATPEPEEQPGFVEGIIGWFFSLFGL